MLLRIGIEIYPFYVGFIPCLFIPCTPSLSRLFQQSYNNVKSTHEKSQRLLFLSRKECSWRSKNIKCCSTISWSNPYSNTRGFPRWWWSAHRLIWTHRWRLHFNSWLGAKLSSHPRVPKSISFHNRAIWSVKFLPRKVMLDHNQCRLMSYKGNTKL